MTTTPPPCHLPTCQHIADPSRDGLSYARCAECQLLFDPVTGHHCPPTHDGLYDDAQVQAWLITTPDHLTAYRDAHRDPLEITTPAELAAAAAERDRLNVSPMVVDHLPGCTLTHNPTSSACPPFGHPMRQGEARTLEVEGEPQS